jgi:hypothetical protein
MAGVVRTVYQNIGQWVNPVTLAPAVANSAHLHHGHLVVDDEANAMEAYSQAGKRMDIELAGRPGPTDHANPQERGDGLSPVCPYSIRCLLKAGYNARVIALGAPSDGDYIRFKTFWGTVTIGFALTLTARVIRVAWRVGTFIPSLLISWYQQATYGPYMPQAARNHNYNIIKEDAWRIAYEIIDLGATLLCFGIGFINTISPEAIPTAWLRDYYAHRIDDVRQKNDWFIQARNAYNRAEQARQAAFNAPPHNPPHGGAPQNAHA